MKRCIVSLLLLLVATSLAVTQPFTRRSSQPQYDGLKQYYEIPNFKLGGRYELADPSKWKFGGEGGTTLESLGAGKLRTAYIAVGTPRRNAAGEIINAVQFPTDVVDFVELGNVVVNSPTAIDRLVNGPSSETTVGVAPTPTSAAPTAGLNK